MLNDEDNGEVWHEYGRIIGSEFGEYLVLTKQEAYDYAISDLIDNHDQYYHEMKVQMGDQYRFFDRKAWAEWVIKVDGLNNVLGTYDGIEELQKYNGFTFLLYRVN